MSLVHRSGELPHCTEQTLSALSGRAIKEAVEGSAAERLRSSSYRQTRHVRCEFHDGVLTLHGRVSSYYIKQLVQALVSSLEFVVVVRNQVEVA